MKKHYYLFWLLCLGFCNLYAQDWQWGKSGGSYDIVQSFETVKGMVTDADGNVYLSARVGKTGLQIGGVPKTAYGNPDVLIASFSCDGQYRWSKVIGSTSNDLADGFQTDTDGNIYVAGTITRITPTYFGGETDDDMVLPSSPGNVNLNKERLFLAKYSQQGELQWIRLPQATDVSLADSNSLTLNLQTDPEGNSYWLCAILPGTYAEGAFVNTAEGISTVIFKYDAAGIFIEAHPLDIQLSGVFPMLNMARNHTTGRLYIAGYKNIQTGPTYIGGDELTENMFLAAFNADGSFLWKNGNTNSISGEIGDICIDEQNNLYLTGGTRDGDTFSGATFNISDSGVAPFAIKLNADGGLIWSSNAEIPTGNIAYGITLAGNEVALATQGSLIAWGDVVIPVVPNAGTDPYIVRLDKNTGEVIAIPKMESDFGYFEYSSAIAADAFGNYYLGGRFQNFLHAGDDTLTNGAQEFDIFVAKYGTDNCDCALPVPEFGFEPGAAEMAFNFTYTGSAYETISWDFGNGDTSTEESPAYTYNEAGMYNVCVTVENECGSETYCTEVSATMGTGAFGLASVKVYPNPADNVLTVTGNEELAYTLYSVLGAEVGRGDLTEGHSQIKLDGMAAGWYLLKLQNASGQQKTVKIFKN